MGRWTKTVAGGLVMASSGTGCIRAQDDPSRFREPLPLASDVSLAMPGSTASTTTKSIQSGDGGTGTGTGTGYAKYYQRTRDLADAVDWGTAIVLGAVWIVAHTPPTTVEDHKATWGPGQGDALSPVVWRLVVSEVGDREYDYELDGRPKDSTNDGDFKAVLEGHGYGASHDQHKNGWFSLDHDAYRALDPARESESGTTKVTHRLHSFPRTIGVEIKRTASARWDDLDVVHQADGSGSLDVSALDDIEALDDGDPEDIVVHSRWAKNGAGRADAQISGGDMPTLVKASECWASTFVRSYYTDNVGYEATVGDPAACAFPDAQF